MRSGKASITIEGAKYNAVGKNTLTSVSFEWSGEKIATTSKKGGNPQWNEVS